MVHPFYAMASDCAAHLCGETAAKIEELAAAAGNEVRRIEPPYSRYQRDSELTRINKVAAAGFSAARVVARRYLHRRPHEVRKKS
jgi:hypothetical protein